VKRSLSSHRSFVHRRLQMVPICRHNQSLSLTRTRTPLFYDESRANNFIERSVSSTVLCRFSITEYINTKITDLSITRVRSQSKSVINFAPVWLRSYRDHCLFVWLSVRCHNSKTVQLNFTNFCACFPWPWLGPPLTAFRYAMYFRFYG